MVIKVNSVAKAVPIDNFYIYKDLHLDLILAYTKNTQANKLSEITDLAADYDIAAIRNSILSLFTTLPGQKILSPEFGVNLCQYLFTPISTANAQLIGQNIQQGITTWEPRVTVQQIGIAKDPDNNQYNITLALFIPKFKQSVQLKSILNSSSFYYV